MFIPNVYFTLHFSVKMYTGQQLATGRKVQGSNPSNLKVFSYKKKRPNWLWGPTRFLVKLYRLLFQGQSGLGVKFTTQLHLAPKLGMSGATFVPPVCLHGVGRDTFALLQLFLPSGIINSLRHKSINKLHLHFSPLHLATCPTRKDTKMN
jgi:hypothetical protein